MPKYKRTERANLLAKLKQFQPEEEEGKSYDYEWVRKIDDGNISDLKPEEIPDDCVSEVETTLESLEGPSAQNNDVMDAQAAMDK